MSSLLQQAQALHQRILVFDGHLDIPAGFGGEAAPADQDGPGQFDLVKAARGGLGGACLAVHAPLARGTAQGAASGRKAQETRHAAILRMAQAFPDRVAIAHSPEDLREIHEGGRLAVVIGFQNAAPLEDDLSAIRGWVDRGVRMFGFCFIGNNAFADSARPYPFAGKHRNGGLSPLGHQAVDLLNGLGVVVDVSQLSSEALADVLQQSGAPVVASHSGPRGLIDKRRNLTDAEIQAIAAGGGLVNIVGFGPYLVASTEVERDRLRQLWETYELDGCRTMDDAIFHPDTASWPDERFGAFMHEFHEIIDLAQPKASVSHLVDAIDHAVKLVGIDHVGISSDFNHGGGLADWRNAGETHNVTAELLRRGYGEAEIAKLWGENFLRVWTEVRKAAVAAVPA